MKAWLQSFGNEIVSDDVSAKIDLLLKEEIDVKEEPFGRYEEKKSRIIVNIKIASKKKKRKKMIKNLEKELGTLGKGKEPLQLNQGLGEDNEQDSGDEDEEAEEKEDEKGKAVVVVMPQRKKAQISKKKKKVATPPPLTKPRTTTTSIAKKYLKKKVEETTGSNEP